MTTLFLALGLACGGDDTVTTTGQAFERYVPLDGYRYWEFQSEDPFATWTAHVAKSNEPDSSSGYDVYTLTTTNVETDSVMRTLRISSDGDDGVLIHGYEVKDAGDGSSLQNLGSADFDPPMVFGSANMANGDAVTTETGGTTYTSTFDGTVACPNPYTEAWENCRRIVVTDDEAEGDMASPIAGSWWLVEGYGIAWYQLTGDTEAWKLSKLVYRDEPPDTTETDDSGA